MCRQTVVPLHLKSMLASLDLRDGLGAGELGDSTGVDGRGKTKFLYRTTGEVSSSSAMKEELVDELGDP